MADERVQRRLAAIRCYIQTHFRLLQKDFLAVADKSSLDLKPPRFCILLVATFEIVGLKFYTAFVLLHCLCGARQCSLRILTEFVCPQDGE